MSSQVFLMAVNGCQSRVETFIMDKCTLMDFKTEMAIHCHL